jgi:hypothetical protein
VSGALLVSPVCGRALLTDCVHPASSDLNLHAVPTRTYNRRMKRSVAIGLGAADVVMVFALENQELLVDSLEDPVAICDTSDDDAHTKSVPDLVYLEAPRLHLAPHGAGALESPVYFAVAGDRPDHCCHGHRHLLERASSLHADRRRYRATQRGSSRSRVRTPEATTQRASAASETSGHSALTMRPPRSP